MNPRNFFAELKRRNVYKVALAYAVVAWLSPLFDDPRFAAFEEKIAHSAPVPSAEPAPTP